MKVSVLVIAPSLSTKGGITSVIENYKSTDLWEIYNCRHFSTYYETNWVSKILSFLYSLFYILFIINQFSIVHIHFSEPTSCFRKLFFLFIAKLHRKPVIVHFHGFSSFEKHNIFYKYLYSAMFSYSDSIIVLSNYWKQSILKNFKIKTTINIINNPSINIVDEKNINKENIILYAGSIINRKGYQDLILAFNLISNKYPNWILCLAGSGEINIASKIVNDLALEDRVKFLGWINGKEKDIFFTKSKIFCLPSYAEGFPMAILDAFSYGLPVITTNLDCYAEILLNNYNSLLYVPGDILQLSNHLSSLIENQKLVNILVTNSRKMLEDDFLLIPITNKLKNLYDSILIN
jgi:glycosyltransferase involved in cell wall biosynthesis